jgi:hypothetical protein
MILLGAYGDALGAYHEPRGLQGLLTAPTDIARLKPVRTYHAAGRRGEPWWVWPDADQLDPEMRGVPTDDTAFRVMILQTWLCSLEATEPTEAGFEQWMRDQLQPGRIPAIPSWRQNYKAQMQDWVTMFEDAERWNATADQIDPTNFDITSGNPFFRPGVPIVFGLFMYLELAALYKGCSGVDVMNHFASLSQLDHGYAGAITGLFAGLIATAAPSKRRGPAYETSFTEWYVASTRHLLSQWNDHPKDRELLQEHFETMTTLGTVQRHVSEETFLGLSKEHVYDPALPPAPAPRAGFRNFDPLLFFKQITAAVVYADGDIRKALRLLASGPGDADTLPSVLGTLAGAWYGEAELRRLAPGLDEDLTHTLSSLENIFGINLDERIDCLCRLSASLGC